MSYFVCVFFFFIVIQILRFALDDTREKILHFFVSLHYKDTTSGHGLSSVSGYFF